MEAKGCAKPAVWKNARRYFYWALRAKLQRIKFLNQIVAASPGNTPDGANKLLSSLLPPAINAKDHRAVSEALEAIDLEPTLLELRSANVTRQVKDFLSSGNRKAALAGLINVVDSLNDEERVTLQTALSRVGLDPGTPIIRYPLLMWH